MNEGKDNLIVKDFIKWGEHFVWTYQFVDELEDKVKVEEEIVETSKAVGEDLLMSSVESPILPADSLPPLSPCLSPGWGALLPSPVPPKPPHSSPQQ